MGEIADLYIDGTLCQICGLIMEDLISDKDDEVFEGPGYPRTCEDCE